MRVNAMSDVLNSVISVYALIALEINQNFAVSQFLILMRVSVKINVRIVLILSKIIDSIS